MILLKMSFQCFGLMDLISFDQAKASTNVHDVCSRHSDYRTRLSKGDIFYSDLYPQVESSASSPSSSHKS